MSYKTVNTPFPTEEFHSRKNKPGYDFKLCPYSDAYRDRYTVNGTILIGVDTNNNPITDTGSFVLGNSTNPDFFGVAVSSYTCSEHTTTSGNMKSHMHPPGWICTDPNCWYKVNTGKFYTEV